MIKNKKILAVITVLVGISFVNMTLNKDKELILHVSIVLAMSGFLVAIWIAVVSRRMDD